MPTRTMVLQQTHVPRVALGTSYYSMNSRITEQAGQNVNNGHLLPSLESVRIDLQKIDFFAGHASRKNHLSRA